VTVAIVSGVGPDLGRAIALALADAGFDLALAARDAARLEVVADEVRERGRTAIAVPIDITVPADRRRLVDATLDDLGGLDALVNNAFAMGPTTAMRSADDADGGFEAWRSVFEINVFATMALSLLCAETMAAGAGGSIVTINTQAMRRQQPRRGAYAASKAALLAATNVLAGEMGPKGVRVNTVVPGPIWSPTLEAFYDGVAERRGVEPRAVIDDVTREMALRRIPHPHEVAAAVVFLASPAASAITGQTLDVNAGNWFA
jgi:NAD(P)-dependent dehydrogenase (short-subunit alcohol dehydrogenase family)